MRRNIPSPALLLLFGLVPALAPAAAPPRPLPREVGESAASPQRGMACTIGWSRPRSSERVGHGVPVQGTATLAPGLHLWVFARHVRFRTTDVWWPQGEGVVSPDTRVWEVYATIGEPRDVGAEFDVTVAVFSREQHQKIASFLQQAQQKPVVPPRPMPPAVCTVAPRTVRKTGVE